MTSIELTKMICDIFTAIGTCAAVIVALWLAYRDSKPMLRVYAIAGVLMPSNSRHIWINCVNIGKQAIVCTGLAFKPYKIGKNRALRIIPKLEKSLEATYSRLPCMLQYSESINQHFSAEFFKSQDVKDILVKYKWLAKLQMKFLWRVVAITNIKEFEGSLSSALIEKIILEQFG